MAKESLSRLEVDNYSLNLSQGKFLVTGQIMSIDLLPEDILKRDISKLLGKEARLEHAVPELEPYSVVGEVTRVWWDELVNAPFAEIEVYDDSDVTSNLRKVLIEDQKLPLQDRFIKGFSIGILKYTNKEGKIKKILPREVSFTENPVCEECTINSVMVYSKMAENKSLEILQASFSGQLKAKEEIISLKDSEISSLKEKLKTEKAEFSATQDSLMKEIKAKTDVIEAKETEISQMTEKYSKLEAELVEANKGKLNAEKAPLVEALLTVYSLDLDSEAYSKKRATLFEKSADELKEKIEDFDVILKKYSKVGGVQFGNVGIPQTGSGGKAESAKFSKAVKETAEGRFSGLKLKAEDVRDVM